VLILITELSHGSDAFSLIWGLMPTRRWLLSEDEVLSRLLALNLERSGQQSVTD